jgi:Lon protease-like protein
MSPEQLANLPVFPLPGLVFLPGSQLPLHIFEERYRAMIRWCLEAGSPLAVGRIEPGHEGEQLGDPPLVEVLGVGRIERHLELPDGRYNVVLRGFSRVRLLEELAPHASGFRRFRAEDLPARPATAEGFMSLSTLRACAAALSTLLPAPARAIQDTLDRGDAPDIVACRLGSMLLGEPDQRQAFLEQDSTDARLAQVAEHVAELLGRFSGPVRPEG